MCIFVFIAWILPGQARPGFPSELAQGWQHSPWQGCLEQGQPQIPMESFHKALLGAKQALGTLGYQQSPQEVPPQVALGTSR